METLHDRLQYENNITLNPVTIYRIVKRNNRRYTSTYAHTQKKWKKKLFSHQTPGLELQMDTTYPFGYKQGRVIYTVIDDASRWVFAWSYETANAINTIDFIQRLQARTPFVIQKIRTDCGKEFIAKTVEEYLNTQAITHRRNTPYCPEENGKIETYKIDLRSTKFITSSAFQIHQNDVIYVGANTNKLKTLNVNPNFQRDLSLGLTVISTLALILNTISILKR